MADLKMKAFELENLFIETQFQQVSTIAEHQIFKVALAEDVWWYVFQICILKPKMGEIVIANMIPSFISNLTPGIVMASVDQVFFIIMMMESHVKMAQIPGHSQKITDCHDIPFGKYSFDLQLFELGKSPRPKQIEVAAENNTQRCQVALNVVQRVHNLKAISKSRAIDILSV